MRMRKVIITLAASLKGSTYGNWIYKITAFLRLPEIAHYIWDIHDAIFGSEQTKAWKQMEIQHKRELQQVETLLQDDESIKTYHQLLQFRKTRRRKYLKGTYCDHQYFQKDFMKLNTQEAFVGCGGFNGDTANQFAAYTNYKYKHIHIFEPDCNMITELTNNTKHLSDVTIYHYAVWSKKMMLFIDGKGGPSTCKVCSKEESTGKIEAITIDEVFADKEITFLQMDIEGSEMEALKGAEKTIRHQHPLLAICMYHKPDDFYQIPLFIHEVFEGYTFFIRHHCKNRGSETVCYAVPKDKLGLRKSASL